MKQLVVKKPSLPQVIKAGKIVCRLFIDLQQVGKQVQDDNKQGVFPEVNVLNDKDKQSEVDDSMLIQAPRGNLVLLFVCYPC